MKIDIEHIKYLKSELKKINKTPLEKIKFYEDKKLIKIDKELVKEFKFTGLANVDFIVTGFYKKGYYDEN
jgi:predicted ATP-grasp superfamily ATP-dependent carboligase